MEVLYTAAPEESYLDAAITTALQVHCDEEPGGDVLVFLTGQVRRGQPGGGGGPAWRGCLRCFAAAGGGIGMGVDLRAGTA